jgi:hypothetical protein
LVGIKKAVELKMGQYYDIQKTRTQELNGSDICVEADYVLYWMRESQRMEYNHALEYAIQLNLKRCWSVVWRRKLLVQHRAP